MRISGAKALTKINLFADQRNHFANWKILFSESYNFHGDGFGDFFIRCLFSVTLLHTHNIPPHTPPVLGHRCIMLPLKRLTGSINSFSFLFLLAVMDGMGMGYISDRIYGDYSNDNIRIDSLPLERCSHEKSTGFIGAISSNTMCYRFRFRLAFSFWSGDNFLGDVIATLFFGKINVCAPPPSSHFNLNSSGYLSQKSDNRFNNFLLCV